ncbi:hypothetical protein EGT62_14600 [Acinetobacter junii]|nr:hypothetical protein EGT62_14600 [Acinetobacter junii]
MTNISKHPCANKCSEFKEEPCNHCLIPSNSLELESTESDFLVGDDQYIENLISPNYRNISNDEHIHLSNALAAQKEIS